jgi:hypothetical protein
VTGEALASVLARLQCGRPARRGDDERRELYRLHEICASSSEKVKQLWAVATAVTDITRNSGVALITPTAKGLQRKRIS